MKKQEVKMVFSYWLCTRCDHIQVQEGDQNPQGCAKCKSRRWEHINTISSFSYERDSYELPESEEAEWVDELVTDDSFSKVEGVVDEARMFYWINWMEIEDAKLREKIASSVRFDKLEKHLSIPPDQLEKTIRSIYLCKDCNVGRITEKVTKKCTVCKGDNIVREDLVIL